MTSTMINKDIKSKLYIASVEALNDRDLFDAGLSKLPVWRQEKVSAQKFAKGKNLSLGAGLLLDYALSNAGIEPNIVEIKYGEYEKPYIPDSNIHFNLSHSEQYAICAISNYEIGCDIEKMKKDRNKKIAERFFHEKESKDEGDFYRLWTLKESFIKATGQGLHLPLSSFQIIIGDEIKIEQTFDDRTYYFQEIDQITGYKCAVCTTEKDLVDIELIDIKKIISEI